MKQTNQRSAHLQFDIIIIGASISGIGTAYWLQEKCSGKRYTILEARERIRDRHLSFDPGPKRPVVS